MQKLEASGFYLSPAMRMRLLKTLDTVWEKGRKIEDLKFLIAPVIAQSPSEQAKFYELFDRYLDEIQELPELPKLPKWYERIPKWIYYFIGFLFIGYFGFVADTVIDDLTKLEPEVSFLLPDTIRVDEPFKITNTSQNCDSLNAKFEWQIWDENEQILEHSDTSGFDLHHQIDTTFGNHHRVVKLVYKPQNAPIKVAQNIAIIHCNQTPKVHLAVEKLPTIEDKELLVNVSADVPLEAMDIQWSMGEEQLINSSQYYKTFEESGSHTLNFKAKLKNADGHCEVTLAEQLNISLEENKPFLKPQPLAKDFVKTRAEFALYFWALALLAFVSLLFFALRWLTRKPEEIAPENQQKAKAKAPDKGPYFIPFRDQNGAIKSEPELSRFAQILRMRQEGNLLKIDVPKTLKTTIDGGGFPSLVMSSHSRPSEYLFLIEEHSEHSHLTNLFKYIAKFLAEKEVLIETYYYNQSFKSFWNKEHPKGLTLDLLRRFYPNHRVVILGDGHHFLDRHAHDKPRLQRKLANLFRQWKQRILITAQPLESWTFKEKVLYNLFTIFPADLDGLHDAMAFLEAGLEAEDASTFNLWMEQFEDNAPAPDCNYYRWRSLEDHQEYLKKHPDLMQWLTALAVYPKPNWNLTVAIGKALQPQGIEVNYENLLILSRIGWLKSGNLNPRLRRDLLKNIDPETEQLAREAIQTELVAIENLTQNSFAGRNLNIQKTLNNFSLQPQKKEHQIALKDLLDAGVLTKKHVTELNQDLERKFKPKPTFSNEPSFQQKVAQNISQHIFSPEPEKAPTIFDFLAEDDEPPPAQELPFFTRDFWGAGISGLAFALIALIYLIFNNTDHLHRIAFNESPQPVFEINRDSLKSNFLAVQDFEMDSAVYYNNLAIDIWENYENTGQIKHILTLEERGNSTLINPETFGAMLHDTLDLLFEASAKLFDKSLAFNSNYSKADSNKINLNYNVGVQAFNHYQNQENSPDSVYLNLAKDKFETVLSNNENHWNAFHGKGLVFHNQEMPDSVCVIIDKFIGLQESGTRLNFGHPNLISINDYCGKSSVFIIVENNLNLEEIDALRIDLQEAGFFIIDMKTIPSFRRSEIKYFDLENERLAAAVQNQVFDYFTNNRVALLENELKSRKSISKATARGDIEIFIGRDIWEKQPPEPETPQLEKEPTKQAKKLADFQWFSGNWELSFYPNINDGIAERYGYLTVDVNNNRAEIFYPESNCRGNLQFVEEATDSSGIYLKENFSNSNCVKHSLTITPKSDGELEILALQEPDFTEYSISTLNKTSYRNLSEYDWVSGKWQADVYQANAKDKPNWSVELDLDLKKNIFKVSYPDYPCSGNWKIKRFESRKIWFRESLDVNNDCQNNILVMIERLRNNDLQITFFDETGKRIDGQEILKPVKTSNPPRIFGNGKLGYGLEDPQTGKEILPPTFEKIKDFGQIFLNKNLAEVIDLGDHGVINEKGELVVPTQYQEIIAVANKGGEPMYNLAIARRNGLEGVIDNQGNEVLELIFEAVTIQSENDFLVRYRGKEETISRRMLAEYTRDYDKGFIYTDVTGIYSDIKALIAQEEYNNKTTKGSTVKMRVLNRLRDRIAELFDRETSNLNTNMSPLYIVMESRSIRDELKSL